MTDAKKSVAAPRAKAAATKTASTVGAQQSDNGQQAQTSQTQTQQDAEALLKADHRKVEQLFKQYENADDDDAKSNLADQICKELIVHTKLEEEIFYPACREKDVDDDTLDEAQVEHDGAKVLISELMNGSTDDDYYDAKVTVLSEYIKHHVGEEEKPSDGIFAKARKAGVDMNALGAKIQARKAEFMENIDSLTSEPPQPRSLDLSLSEGGTQHQENDTMPRYSNNDRDRDEQGRFTSDDDDNSSRRGSSSRGGYSSRSSSRDDDDYERGGNGGGRGSSHSGDGRERDEQGRFMSDDDDRGGNGGGRSSSRGGYSSRSSGRERDEQGRFMSDDDDYGNGGRSSTSRGGRGGQGHGGWFSDSEGHSEAAERGWEGRGSSRGGSSSRSSRDDNDDYDRGGRSSRSSSSRGSQGHGGWFGDPEGHSEASERGWEHRGGSSLRSSRDDDDYDRSGRSSRSSSSNNNRSGSSRGGQGHGGWFGDPEGHSEASERGWEHRGSSRGGSSSRSSRDDDDDRGGRSSSRSSSGSSRGGQGQGHGGWFGDPRGHSEAARRGWEDR